MIPSLRVEFADDEVREFLGHAEKVLRTGRLIFGEFTEAIEHAMAELTGCRHAVAVSSGSSALQVIFRSLDLEGKKVLVPTNTFFATAAAAIHAGATVELYDSGLFPDLDDLAARLDPETAAVVVVHIGGYLSPQLLDLVDLCARRGVPLVEDAAHAHGARLHGRPAGGFGLAAGFSFYPTKVITTEQGGMITTNDGELAARARRYRDQGLDPGGVTNHLWGSSWRMSELGAALGVVQLRRHARDAACRQEILARYWSALEGVGGLSFPGHLVGMESSGYKCVAVLPETVDRRALKSALRDEGVELGREVYEVPLHRQPILANRSGDGRFPTADRFCDRHVCLPLWRYLDAADAGRVIAATAEALRAAAAR